MDDVLKEIKPFDCENVSANELRAKWKDYKNNFAYVARTLNKTNQKRIKSLFLARAGRPLQKI